MSLYHVSEEDRATAAGNVVKVYTEASSAEEAERIAAERGPEATIIVFESLDRLVGIKQIDPGSTEAMLATMEERMANSSSLGREIVTEIEELWNEHDKTEDSITAIELAKEIEEKLLWGEDPALPTLIRLALKGLAK